MTPYIFVNIDPGNSMFPDGTKPQLEQKLKVLWHPMQLNFPDNAWDVTDELEYNALLWKILSHLTGDNELTW